jgi:predicted transcriptional regulator
MLTKMLTHELRRRILKLMAIDYPGALLSPRKAADLLGYPLGTVAYHFRVLAKHKAVYLVETRPVRGTVEHLYRLAEAVSSHEWVLTVLRATPDSD